MTNPFKALTHYTLAKDAKVNRRILQRTRKISVTHGATSVMTDLTKAIPFSIKATASVTQASNNMIACGVRLLFVTEDDGSLVGLITATDLLGEKPLQHINGHGGTRSDIAVHDIMTPKDSLEALRLDDVIKASVGDIIETMKICNRQHMLVIKIDEDTQVETVCGIYSSTQISRQLGVAVEPSTRAGSFAELERALLTT